jgi:hypothetical protein
MKQLKSVIALLLLPLLGHAWNGAGHSTGGAIAYYYLKNTNPKIIGKVTEALKSHPWYNNPIWTDKLAGLTGENRDVALFMLASTFPDDARDTFRLGGGVKKQWHYVDFPFVPAGQTVKGTPPESPNAEEKISELLGTIKGQKDPAQKALDICWLFHLIEDVHQPLHTACLFDNGHMGKLGDMGGNDTYFTLPGHTAVKMHSYWDGLVKGSFATTPDIARDLLKKPGYQDNKLGELKTGTQVKDWIEKESFVLAKEKAYRNGAINGTKAQPAAADNNYDSEAKAIAERRIVLAGIRLARELAKIL